MKLTGNAAKEFMEQTHARARQREAETLAAAKADAARRGKEPFNLEKLESMCDTSHEGQMAPIDERNEEFEWKYYVRYPQIMTIEDFAEKVAELSRW